MSRRSLSSILSGQEQSLSDAWRWYEFQRALIGEERGRVLSALAAGQLIAERYTGSTRDELEVSFASQTAELKHVEMLAMLASTEAALRIDFIDRMANRKKDPISRLFWAAYKREGIEKIRLEEDILDTWRQHGSTAVKGAISRFKGALNLRHWLAHGRYWKPKLGYAAGYEPIHIFDVCMQLLQAMGLIASDTPAA